MRNLLGYLFFTWLNITLVSGQLPAKISSELVTVNVLTGEQKIVFRENRHFEAPNWSRDGNYLIINANGFLEKIGLDGKNLGKINPEHVNNCNNDHGLTFDGGTLIISKNEKMLASGANSRIYTVPVSGGIPKLITEKLPSYWHGVSPDGKTLLYVGQRNDEWDIYKINVDDKKEIRLTTATGLDDGPEYSYDGKWIYFNSHRTGRMQLYRMKHDGSEQEQLTSDDFDNWFPHPSPDGKSLAYISYMEDQKGQHPFGKDVRLRLFNVENRSIKDLTPVFYGGQGTINVASWSPDGKYVAFVRYEDLTNEK